MRQALARLDPGAALAVFRTASGLSQQDVADILGWSQSQVSLIEKGQRQTLFDIRELLHFADMVEMPRAALAPMLAGEPDASLGDDALQGLGSEACEEDVDRRGFGGFAAGIAAGVMLPLGTAAPRVTAAHVRYLQSCADSLWQRDQAVGGAATLKQALRHWQRARRMLDESAYPEDVGRELVGVTGALATCAGWLAFDAGNIPLARRMSSEALATAGSTDRPELTAQILTQLSMISSFAARTGPSRGPAREALRLADQAAEVARCVSMPRLHTHIALRHAYAASLLGDEPAFRAAIAQARRELDRGPGACDPHWIQCVDESEIAGYEARGLVSLGDLDVGTALYQKSLVSLDLSPRNRACGHAQFAAMLADGGDMTDALDEGGAVLTSLRGGVSSVRTLIELRPVRVAAERAKAEEFCARFDAAERALIAV
jgi:transcriptional regulator with XRE-family HTH domain